MSNNIFVIIIYLNLLIGNYLLFRGKTLNRFIPLYFVLFIANLFFVEYIAFFLVVLYVLQCYFLYLLVNNFYLSIMLTNLLLNINGFSVFVTFDLPRYIGVINPWVSVVAEGMLIACLLYWLHLLDKKYHIFDYYGGYDMKLKGITIFSTLLMAGLYLAHLSFSLYSLDYVLISIIILLYNLFYTVLFVVFVIYQKKFHFLESHLKDKQETKAYYAKLDEFRHDYLNYIDALEYSLVNSDTEESTALLEHLKDYSLEIMDDGRHEPLKKIQDATIRGLLYNFMEKADQKKITYQVKVLNPVTKISLDPIDLFRLFSIALNNALEHYDFQKQEAPVKILLDRQPGQFYFQISNPAKMEGISLGEIVTRGYSSKRAGRLGLYNFSKIIEQYPNAVYQIKYDKANSAFVLEFTIFDKT